MSRSGTGIAILMFYYGVFLLRLLNSLNKKYLIFGFPVLVAVILVSYFVSEGFVDGSHGRALQVFGLIFHKPEILFSDSSLLYRLYALLVGFISVFIYPFGVGFSGLDDATNTILTIPGLQQIHNFYLESIFGFRYVSSVGLYLQSMGVIFLMPFAYVLYSSKASIEIKVITLCLFCFSYSIAMPIGWILLSQRRYS
jgi:hypothetical protein